MHSAYVIASVTIGLIIGIGGGTVLAVHTTKFGAIQIQEIQEPMRLSFGGIIRSIDTKNHIIVFQATSPYVRSDTLQMHVRYSDATTLSAQDAKIEWSDIAPGTRASLSVRRTAGVLTAGLVHVPSNADI